MNAVADIATPPPGTALTVAQRAAVALNSSEHERKLLELAEASKSITAISNTDGREQCHSARMALKRVRVEIEKIGKSAREEATAFSKAVIAEERRLIGLTEPEEIRLTKIQDAWDAKVAAEKRAKAEAEAQRKADIQARIDEIRSFPDILATQTSKGLAQGIQALRETVIDESFAEFRAQAEGAKATALLRMERMYTAAEAHEAEQERLKAERERLAREKAEQEAAATKERARIEEENRQAQAKREAEARAHEEHLRKQLEEEERQAAERRRVLAEEESAAAARVAAQKAEEARLAEERAELERQQEALRLAQETLAKPSDPVEATAQESVALSFEESERPTDEEIIAAVARAFFVPDVVAAGWIAEMGICRGSGLKQ